MATDRTSAREDSITIFETEDGKTRVEVRFEQDNVWLTQKLMAELYECTADNISLHLKNIFADKELDPAAVTEDSSVTAADGKNYRTLLYSLEAIIAVGYRVQSQRATQFRTWATDRLKDYILKGFAIDSDRFKHGASNRHSAPMRAPASVRASPRAGASTPCATALQRIFWKAGLTCSPSRNCWATAISAPPGAICT